MHRFYKKIIYLAVIGIITFLFLDYVGNQIGDYDSTQRIFGLALRNIGIAVYVLYAVVFMIYWINEAWKKSKKENISFFNSLIVWKEEYDEEQMTARRVSQEKLPKPLTKPIKNGLFWLLAAIGIGVLLIMLLFFLASYNIQKIKPY